jgi:hypothetical protein
LISFPARANPTGATTDDASNVFEEAAPFHEPRRSAREDMLIELTSSNSSAGKTELLYLITAAATLPRSVNGIDIQGKEAAVVFIDTDNRLDVAVLYQSMKQRIKSLLVEAADHQLDTIVESALQHVHIFRPESFPSLLDTIDALPDYLLGETLPQSSHDRPLHSIVLDGLTQFYWDIRADNENRETQALDHVPSATGSIADPRPRYLVLMNKLKDLSQRFECLVIGTTWTLSNQRPEDQGVYLHAAFPTLPVARMETERASVKPFAPCISVEDANLQRQQREEEVKKHKFILTSQGRRAVFNLRNGMTFESGYQ